MQTFLLRFQVPIWNSAVEWGSRRLPFEPAAPGTARGYVASVLAGTGTKTAVRAEGPDADRSAETFFALRARR